MRTRAPRPGRRARWPRAAARPPASEDYDVALLDLDGVVYIGSAAVPGAPEALREAAARGMRLRTSPTTPPARPPPIAGQLSRLGVARSPRPTW